MPPNTTTTTPTVQAKSSPLSIIFRRKTKNSPNDTNAPNNNNVIDLPTADKKTLSPTSKDFKASSSSPPSAEYLSQHRPSCPSVSPRTASSTTTSPSSSTCRLTDQLPVETSTVIMRDNTSKEKSNPLARASYHLNSTTNLLENPNPNSSRERGFGATPSRASSSFTSSRDSKESIYPKYCATRRLRGPYMESKLRNSNTDFSDSESSTSEPPGLISKLTNGSNWANFFSNDSSQKLSFTEELLRETRNRRKKLDHPDKDKITTTSGYLTPERVESLKESKEESDNKEGNEKRIQRPNSIKLKSVKNLHNDTNEEQPKEEKVIDHLEEDITCEGETAAGEMISSSSTCEFPPTTASATTTATTATTTSTVPVDGASIMAVIGQHLDTRTHIVGEMYDLEKSYCEFLRSLLEDLSAVEHSKPDSEQGRVIDTILSRLPSVLEVHSKFLEQLRRRMTQWTAIDSQIGDLFELFRTPVIDDFYEVMVGRLPEFLPFLKQIWKGRNFGVKASGSGSSRCRIVPDDMLIRIIQRMPQYKILLDRLLKNTPIEHSDFVALKCALGKFFLILYLS